MKSPGQTLHEAWVDFMGEQGVLIEGWGDLEDTDRVAWEALGQMCCRQGWDASLA